MSREVEGVLLGALLDAEGPLLQSNAAALLEASGLSPGDLGDGRVRVCWQIAERLAERRRPVDAITIFAAGSATKNLAREDLEWLQSLQVANQLDRDRFAQVAEDLRRQVRGQSFLVSLERYADELRGRKIDVFEAADGLDGVIRNLTALHAEDDTAESDILEIANEWDRQEAGVGPPVVVPTGVEAIDKVIGGFVPNLNVIPALPSVGKSGLIATMMDAQVDLGLKVGLFGLEDGTVWFSRRLLARDLGLALRDIGKKPRDAELGLRFSEVAARHARRLRNVITFKHETIGARELARRAAHWIQNKGVHVIYVDNGSEIDHTTDRADEMRLKVAETYRVIRNVATRYKVPAVVLAHTTRDNEDGERPPRMKEIAESAYIERRARLILGLWSKASEPDFMRATVLKNTEGPRGMTFRLARHVKAAMITRDIGETVNLEAERRNEAKAARERKIAERQLEKDRAAQLAAESKTKGKRAQLELVDGGDE